MAFAEEKNGNNKNIPAGSWTLRGNITNDHNHWNNLRERETADRHKQFVENHTAGKKLP